MQYNCEEPEYQVRREDFSIIFKTNENIESETKCNESGAKCNESEAKCNESEAKCNESEAKCIESYIDVVDNSDISLSKTGKERLIIIIRNFVDKGEFNSTAVAEVLNVSDQVARKSLRIAEKIGILRSKGKTNDKIYFF